MTQIHDYYGASIFQDKKIRAGVQQLSKVMGNFYPEFKGRTIFMNFPAIFTAMWSVWATFVPAKTRSKMIFIGSPDGGKVLDIGTFSAFFRDRARQLPVHFKDNDHG